MATDRGFPHFRLNLEQQGKRAKELLKAARAGEAAALARFTLQPPKLAEAQHLIARDLRFENWAALKRHIAAMAREREVIAGLDTGATVTSAIPLDADLSTLHIRCGSDIRERLQSAGFRGDFLEHSYPYMAVRVREDTLPDQQALLDSAGYERVVIWSEHDCYDQLVLLRLLAHYAAHRCPSRLELINVGTFQGATRFLGLGQLPPEALRLLWQTRQPAAAAQLSLGLAGWHALASADPRALTALMRGGTPALPLLAPALHRHLRELPSVENGLGLTQQMAVSMLAEQPQSLNRIFLRQAWELDPLPGQGDFQVRDRVLPMGEGPQPLISRQPGLDQQGRPNPPWSDVLQLTGTGRAVLRGEVDYMALQPAARWVGGVEIAPGCPDWRWDERRREAVLKPTARAPAG